MLSKRDLQLVRLAVRWKWITPEQGEDLLFLKRKFGAKLTIEEIIRRRGYVDDAEIGELTKAANQLVGRRGRPAPSRKASAVGAKLVAEPPTARSAKPSPSARPPIEAPSRRMPIEAPSTRLTLIDEAEESDPVRRQAPDRAQTVVMMSPFEAKRQAERPTDWMARAYTPEESLGEADSNDDFSALAPPTIVTELPAHVREALARADGPEDDRTAVADRAQVELMRRLMEARAPVPEVVDVEPPRPEPRGAVPRAREISTFDGPAPVAPEFGDLVRPAAPAVPVEAIDDQSTVAPDLDELDDIAVEEDEDELQGLFGPYTIERKVARGARGTLYKVAAPDGRHLALKVLADEVTRARGFLGRLMDAARAAAKIESAHVVRVVDAGEIDGRIFVATEYVDAWTLDERLDSGDRPELLEALRIGRDVARALAAATAHGVVHMDVNPDAILIGRAGEVHLGGFALPKVLRSGAAPLSAGETPLFGTPGYVAPEQVLGDKVDHRADLYALGATLFHLVTGRRVFEGNDATAILAKVTREAAPKTREVNAAIPELAASIVDRLLALHREDRFESAVDVVGALEGAIAALEIYEAERNRAEQSEKRRTMFVRTAGVSAGILAGALLVPAALVRLELLPWTASRFAHHDALAGACAVIFALILFTGLALVRRGELPLPMSSAWLVRLQDGAGALGAALLAGGVVVGPGAILNVVVSLIAAVVLASWVYGILLRHTIARARPDRGVGRVLAVLGDPSLAKWRLVHVPLLATLAALATARWAFLAYFAASAGL